MKIELRWLLKPHNHVHIPQWPSVVFRKSLLIFKRIHRLVAQLAPLTMISSIGKA
jgi:hypothetical protein